ncbi:hypothetical protein CS062_05185 [Roseateles chitinivorans]|uniref:Uncharacterized protein n=2 Tax=Roseateles chitinivorans TaxID=2917965 RepID=A0A2G9CD87_9BURK|nr:hypothetical protein CS062_05185 [Roseateles chitinivorans]
MTDPVVAQTQADLEAATLKANIAEQLKKEAEARKAAAVADADAKAAKAKSEIDAAKAKADADKAAADASKAAADADKARADAAATAAKAANDLAKGKADTDKAQADAEKARFDAVKAGLPTPPDPTKYKIDKPAAPTLSATVAKLTFNQAKSLSSTIAASVAETLAPFVVQPGSTVKGPDTTELKKVALLADDGKGRTLLALSTATKEALVGVDARVKETMLDLKAKKTNQPAPAFGPGALLMIGSLLENVVSYATILRTQYGFATVSVTSNAEAALQALVQGDLARWEVRVVDTDALLPLPPNSSDLGAKLKALRATISAAHVEARDTARLVKQTRENVPAGETEAAKKARMAFADEVERKATELEQTVDEAEKFVAALLVTDVQGNTPFDAAQRGEALADTLTKVQRKLTFTLKVITSDADTVATDRLFAGFKVFAGNTTVARWKLTNSDGVVAGAGAEMLSSAPARITLTGE